MSTEVRQPLLLGCQNVHGALEVLGDGGEADLDGGFGEASLSHPAQAIAAFPCTENLLDPPADAMDRLIPLVELAQRFGFVAAPYAGGDKAAWRLSVEPDVHSGGCERLTLGRLLPRRQ